MNAILSINASHEVRGGADRFFTELNRLMLDRGQRVVTFTYRPALPIEDAHSGYSHYFVDRELYPKGILNKITGTIGVFYAHRILKELERVIDKEKPAIAHIHNIYHRFPYGIIDVLNRHGIMTVSWLHDYKWICPNHQLYTQGELCKRCAGGNYTNAVRYRCQLGSLYKSAVVSAFAYFVASNHWRDKVDCFIAPSRSVYERFRDFDFPVSKIKVLPHFNYSAGSDNDPTDGRMSEDKAKPYALYAGRIEENKGLFHCVQAFGKSGHPLKIVGTGNYEKELKKYCRANEFDTIEFVGYVAPDKLGSYYRDALFTVVPSIWYEVFGLAIIESYSFSRPVVAACLGAIPEIVEDGKTGMLYRPGDAEDLERKVRWMFDNPDAGRQMGLYARGYVGRCFSAESYWNELQTIHDSLVHH